MHIQKRVVKRFFSSDIIFQLLGALPGPQSPTGAPLLDPAEGNPDSTCQILENTLVASNGSFKKRRIQFSISFLDTSACFASADGLTADLEIITNHSPPSDWSASRTPGGNTEHPSRRCCDIWSSPAENYRSVAGLTLVRHPQCFSSPPVHI